MKQIKENIEISGREHLELEISLSENEHVQSWSLQGIGDLDFLHEINNYRKNQINHLSDFPPPEGQSVASLFIRELVAKAKGEWEFPFKEEILCNCRGIPLATVDQSILAGAHSPEEVSAQTSASTACGTCRIHVEGIIKYRKGED